MVCVALRQEAPLIIEAFATSHSTSQPTMGQNAAAALAMLTTPLAPPPPSRPAARDRHTNGTPTSPANTMTCRPNGVRSPVAGLGLRLAFV